MSRPDSRRFWFGLGLGLGIAVGLGFGLFLGAQIVQSMGTAQSDPAVTADRQPVGATGMEDKLPDTGLVDPSGAGQILADLAVPPADTASREPAALPADATAPLAPAPVAPEPVPVPEIRFAWRIGREEPVSTAMAPQEGTAEAAVPRPVQEPSTIDLVPARIELVRVEAPASMYDSDNLIEASPPAGMPLEAAESSAQPEPQPVAMVDTASTVPRSADREPTPQRVPVPAFRDHLVLIPGGSFMMGDRDGAGLKYERPAHQADVNAFYLSPREISRAEWYAVMNSYPADFPGLTPEHPVEFVTWYEAITFCNAMSARHGLRPAYRIVGRTVTWDRGADGYRLLTETEWEYAARGGDTFTGRMYAGGRLPATVAIFEREGPAQVGSLVPNAFGLFDMSGNVAEWCWDMFDSYDKPRSEREAATGSGERALRGGAWYGMAMAVSVSARGSANPANRLRGVGLRVARSLQDSE